MTITPDQLIDHERFEQAVDSARPPVDRRLIGVTAATEPAWRAAVDSDPFALPEQSPEWIRAICSVSRARDVSRAYTFSDGSVCVVPLVRTGLFATGSVWSPPPAWGVGGIVGPDIDGRMVAAIVEDLRDLGAPRLSIRTDTRHDEFWRQSIRDDDHRLPRRSHVIDLHESPEAHHALLSKSTRRSIRKAEQAGVRVEVCRTGELIDTHYALYLLSVRRWAAKQREPVALALFRARRRDPIEKFHAMRDALGDRFITVVSYVGDQPASSSIVLLGPTTRDTRGAMDIEIAGPAQANYAMQWRAIQEAYEFGSRRYHLGESGDSEGIAHFKEKFGATPFDHHEYRIERFPITRTTDLARDAVKRVIGFRDT